MNDSERIQRIISILRELEEGQIALVEEVASLLSRQYIKIWRFPSSDFVDDCLLYTLGDLIRVHHAYSKGPFTKDKFEYALEKAKNLCGIQAELASSGNPGHDITISGIKVSLKTEAEGNIHIESLHISKFMELGKGVWSDKLEDFYGLRDQFFAHMQAYERIFTLRCLSKRNDRWYYELVEIPIGLLEEARNGIFRKANVTVVQSDAIQQKVDRTSKFDFL